MFVYSVRLTYTESNGNYITNHYYIIAQKGCFAVDKALTSFLKDNNLNFDDDIDNIEWSYCAVKRISF